MNRLALPKRWICGALAAMACACAPFRAHAESPSRTSPQTRGVAYLAREVPRWRADHRCASCHHNGDAARVLYRARALGFDVPDSSLASTTAWLRRPADWDDNPGDPGASDNGLARLQFATALSVGVRTRAIDERDVLAIAVERIANDQAADGSWRIDAEGAVGSPATYGTPLATWRARELLASVDRRRYRNAIARADRWLSEAPIASTLDAAVALWATDKGGDEKSKQRSARAMELLARGQSRDGGWGPYATAAPEAFDTAVALLALTTRKSEADIARRIARGRQFLVATQSDDGHWPETTRPSGGESYAQRVSTTAWATWALIEIRDDKQEGNTR